MNIIIERKKEHTKLPAVMRAAIHLFVNQGIRATTIKDIARRAKVAQGALYRHFKSKDDLAWHLFSTHLSQFTAELMGAVYPIPTARERIHKFVAESFGAYEDDHELYSYLILQEHSELDKYAKTSVHPGHVVTKIIEDGQKAGEIREGDRYLLGSLFIGAVIRVCVVKMYGNIRVNLKTQAAPVADMIWEMLRSKP